MKRSPALAPLSRDHQHALDAALRLRRARPDTVADALAHFRDFFEREGRAHFAIEEEHLLPALPADSPGWAAAVARIREDHDAIRDQARTLAGSAARDDATADAGERRADRPAPVEIDLVAAARDLGERLSAHVRFEERTLFELLEARLTPVELARLGNAVARAEAQRLR